MKARILISAALAALCVWAPMAQAADVGVSIGISQPGVYGRIDIGRFPQPQVIMEQPVIIRPHRHAQPVAPMYLWVPPGHQKRWSQYCGRYNACGAPVYFVQDRWYREQGPGRRWEDGRRNDREPHWDDRRDRPNGNEGGHGRDRGHGRGHDRG